MGKLAMGSEFRIGKCEVRRILSPHLISNIFTHLSYPITSFLVCLALMFALLSPVAYAATSANYAISAEVIDLGGASMESATYNMFGKLGEIVPDVTTSPTYTMEGRFLGIVYGTGTFSTFETPTVTGITPNSGYNDKAYSIFITGTNISSDATAGLYKTGQTPISPIAGTVTHETTASMECAFNLTGAAVGSWDLRITNTGFGRTSPITAADVFTVLSMGELRIIGTPVNNPNPFNPNEGPTKLKYTLSSAATINLYLFNQKGELIWQKTYGPNENGGRAGDNDPTWNGVTDFRESVPTGVYVLRIVSRSGGSTKELGRVKVAVLRN